MTPSMSRVIVLTLVLALSGAALTRASKSEPTPARTPLADLPFRFSAFEGTRAPDLEREVLDVLGVDDYINRTYRVRETRTAIGLYVGYYMSQREGDTMHSPLNCLPGAGWQPVSTSHLVVPAGGRSNEVNRIVIEKAGERLLVFYWYQSHGRVVASEYWGKIYTVVGALRMNRTDAALVRVIVPIRRPDAASEKSAEAEGLQFLHEIFPLLDRHIPV